MLKDILALLISLLLSLSTILIHLVQSLEIEHNVQRFYKIHNILQIFIHEFLPRFKSVIFPRIFRILINLLNSRNNVIFLIHIHYFLNTIGDIQRLYVSSLMVKIGYIDCNGDFFLLQIDSQLIHLFFTLLPI